MNLSKAEFQDQTHSSVADDGTARSWLLRGKSVTRGWLDKGPDDLVHLPITVIPPPFLDDSREDGDINLEGKLFHKFILQLYLCQVGHLS